MYQFMQHVRDGGDLEFEPAIMASVAVLALQMALSYCDESSPKRIAPAVFADMAQDFGTDRSVLGSSHSDLARFVENAAWWIANAEPVTNRRLAAALSTLSYLR